MISRPPLKARNWYKYRYYCTPRIRKPQLHYLQKRKDRKRKRKNHKNNHLNTPRFMVTTATTMSLVMIFRPIFPLCPRGTISLYSNHNNPQRSHGRPSTQTNPDKVIPKKFDEFITPVLKNTVNLGLPRGHRKVKIGKYR